MATAKRQRVTLSDIVNAGYLAEGSLIYNIAHNIQTKKQDRLYARITRLDHGSKGPSPSKGPGQCQDPYILTVIDGQIIPAGTRFLSLNSFMRAHLNEKILRGETERLTLTANVWDWTFTDDGCRLRQFRDSIGRESPSAEELELLRDAMSYCDELFSKYCPSKKGAYTKKRDWILGSFCSSAVVPQDSKSIGN
jgi:hypothetical protein